MKKYREAYKHLNLEEIFPDVYYVVGSMKLLKGVFKYSRNMVIIRDEDSLALINPIRLNEKEETELLKLGKIKHIFKIGRLHSIDIPYYVDKFGADLWMFSDDDSLPGYSPNHLLDDYEKLPFKNILHYRLKTSKIPESILIYPENEGILISCDSIVNMQGNPDIMANKLVNILSKIISYPVYIGPNWVKVAKPKKCDFVNILNYDFKHLLPAHGAPLKSKAKEELSNYIDNYKKWS